MKRIILKIALFFGLLSMPLLALFIFPYSKEFAYHFIKNDCYNHGAWIYDRIVKNPIPIDMAFIGSSHTIHAFQEKKMEEILGPEYHLANLGYCRYGRNLQYSILKMLLQHKQTKIVVIEVHEDEEKNSHDIFPYIADSNDLLLTPTLINRDYFSDVFHGAVARFEYFKAKYVFVEKTADYINDLYGYGGSDRTVLPEELADNKKAWDKRKARKTVKEIEKIQMQYPLAYLKKMTEMLKSKNIPFVFVYLPESGSAIESPKYAGYYKKIAPLFIPPLNELNKSEYWMDASHLNDKGSEILSKWVAEKLKNEFCLKTPDSIR